MRVRVDGVVGPALAVVGYDKDVTRKVGLDGEEATFTEADLDRAVDVLPVAHEHARPGHGSATAFPSRPPSNSGATSPG